MPDLTTRLPPHTLDRFRPTRPSVPLPRNGHRRTQMNAGQVDHLLRIAPAVVLTRARWPKTAGLLRERPPIDQDALSNADVLARHLICLREADDELASIIALTTAAGKNIRARQIQTPAALTAQTIQLLGPATVDELHAITTTLTTPPAVDAARVALSLIGRTCHLAIWIGNAHRLAGADLHHLPADTTAATTIEGTL